MKKRFSELLTLFLVATVLTGCADTVQTVDTTKSSSNAKVVTESYYDKDTIDKTLQDSDANSSFSVDGMSASEIANLPIKKHNGKKCYYYKEEQKIPYDTVKDGIVVHKDGFMCTSEDGNYSEAEWEQARSICASSGIDFTIKIKFNKKIAHKSKYVTLSKDKKTAIWKLSKCKKSIKGIYAYTKGSKHNARDDVKLIQGK